MSSAVPGIRSSKRRRRRPPKHYQAYPASEEQRFLQQAIQNSKLDKGRPADGKIHLPWAPVFYPTVEEFQGNPLDYIERVCRPIAEQYGICKIVPPDGWHPTPFCIREDNDKRFQTKLQVIHRLQEGISYGDGVEYSPSEYQKEASRRTKEWKAQYYPDHDLLSRHATALEINNNSTSANDDENTNVTNKSNNANNKRFLPENLERDYWDIVETHSRQVTVEYGNDVDAAAFGSAFPLSERGRSVNGTIDPDKVDAPEPEFGTEEYFKESYWNLNNFPNAPGSVLRHVKVGINGINVPWMYYGSLFTTFAYHNEDNYLYSINYNHRGAPKQWYGVPGNKIAADGLEKVFKSYLSMKMREVPDLLHHITTMFSPRLLQNAEVPVCRQIQYEGEFIVTFPRAFHGGFSYGPNAGEAVNFACHDWIKFGADANERYRSFARPAVFSHDRLTMTLANHLEDQTNYHSCKLLLEELKRIVKEEIDLRSKLEANGVRDVSSMIKLPKNRVDQLDTKSASYDDKRLCHACKHVCFFSAVACECSQSKVSCLRHSHFMCRCPPEKRYFMIWSQKDELDETICRVAKHTEMLKEKEGVVEEDLVPTTDSEDKIGPLPQFAPGAEKDFLRHKNDEIWTGYLFKDYQSVYSVCTSREELDLQVEEELRRRHKTRPKGEDGKDEVESKGESVNVVSVGRVSDEDSSSDVEIVDVVKAPEIAA